MHAHKQNKVHKNQNQTHHFAQKYTLNDLNIRFLTLKTRIRRKKNPLQLN